MPWNNYAGKVTLAGDAAHPMVPCKYFDHHETITNARLYIEQSVHKA